VVSSDTAKRLVESLTSPAAGNEILNILNKSAQGQSQASWSIPAAIVAAHTSTTTDFAALAVGDLLIHIPAVAGNAVFETVATAGTKPSAAVVGDLYIALRAIPAVPASNVVL